MIIYNDCITIQYGTTDPHTLKINNANISIQYMNNLNQGYILECLHKNDFKLVAIAFDKQEGKYHIFTNENGTIAIKNDSAMPLQWIYG